jgi:hypothetical protein
LDRVETQELVDCRSREFRVCHVEHVVSVGNREQFGVGNSGLEHVGDRPTADCCPGTHDVEHGLTDPRCPHRGEIPVEQRFEVVLKRTRGVLIRLVTNTGYVFVERGALIRARG